MMDVFLQELGGAEITLDRGHISQRSGRGRSWCFFRYQQVLREIRLLFRFARG